MTVKLVKASECFESQAKQAGAQLIDVRTPAEYREIHAQGATLAPLDQLDPAKWTAEAAQGCLYLICKSGARAAKAAEKFCAAGISNVAVVEGGTTAWEQAGLPVGRGKKTMSLERQVRIAAGALVLLGVLLGCFVHRALFGLAGFVGAGLIFAGITDTCAMGMLIAKMPWNNIKLDGQSPSCATSCCTGK